MSKEMRSSSPSDTVNDLSLSTITGTELADVSESPDPKTVIEEVSAERDRLKEELEDLRQNRDERKKYAHRIFTLICAWIAGLFVLLIFQGFGHYQHFRFDLTQPVLLGAIGSTTVNVLGIFYIVAHYLFPSKNHVSANSPAAAKRSIKKKTGQMRHAKNSGNA